MEYLDNKNDILFFSMSLPLRDILSLSLSLSLSLKPETLLVLNQFQYVNAACSISPFLLRLPNILVDLYSYLNLDSLYMESAFPLCMVRVEKFINKALLNIMESEAIHLLNNLLS